MAEKLRDVMGNARLSSSARLAYWWIRATARGGYSYETSTALAGRIGVTPQQVSGIARELAEANLIRRERAGRGAGVLKRWALLGATLAAFGSLPAPSDASPIQAHACAQNRFIIKTQKRRKGARRHAQAADPEAA